MSAIKTWRVRVDEDGPILWLFDMHGQPIEAFQADWKHGGTWDDVLPFVRTGIADIDVEDNYGASLVLCGTPEWAKEA